MHGFVPPPDRMPDRQLPADLEVEQALLGALLNNNDAVRQVIDFLRPEHFFEPVHQAAYEGVLTLARDGRKATAITVRRYIEHAQFGDMTPGQYLAKLVSEATTTSNADDYGRTIHDLAQRRALIAAYEQLLDEAYTAPPDADPLSLIDQTTKAVIELEEHATQGRPRARLIMSSRDFTSDFEPPDYLIRDLLRRRFIYSMTATTGSGKTSIALLIAAHVALGLPFGGREVERGRVLYMAGENPDDVRMRWIAMAEHMSFDPSAVEVYFIAGQFDIAALETRMRKEVETIGELGLAIVDTSAAYFYGDEENNNVEMGAHARMLRRLVNLPGGPTVLVPTHPAKGANAADRNSLSPRGGGAYVAEMDGNLVVVKREEGTALHHGVKLRGPDFEPIPFENRSVTARRLVDSRGRPLHTVIARLLTEDEQAAREAQTVDDSQRVLLLFDTEEDLSVAKVATTLGWLDRKGKPAKSKAQRIIDALRKDKLLKAELDGSSAITKEGRDAAKKVRTARSRLYAGRSE